LIPGVLPEARIVAVILVRWIEKRSSAWIFQYIQPQKKEFVMVNKTCKTFCLLVFVLSLTTMLVGTTWASYTKEDKAIERISPEEARQLVESGQALLVCSYDDDSCKSKLIQGALLQSELEARLASLSKETQIIFYCG
jgi:hypothetical protein